MGVGFIVGVCSVVDLISGQFPIGMVDVCFAAERISLHVRIMHVCRVSVF